jgi:hypothetical protein
LNEVFKTFFPFRFNWGSPKLVKILITHLATLVINYFFHKFNKFKKLLKMSNSNNVSIPTQGTSDSVTSDSVISGDSEKKSVDQVEKRKVYQVKITKGEKSSFYYFNLSDSCLMLKRMNSIENITIKQITVLIDYRTQKCCLMGDEIKMEE